MQIRRSAFVIQLMVLLELSAGNALSARAEQLLFQRGGTLYTAERDGTGTRPLFDLGPGLLLPWAASPDGRRVAWLRRREPVEGGPPSAPNLRDQPATALLSDQTGRHQKPLFATDTLRDRQGKKITSLGVRSPAEAGDNPDLRKFALWEPVSLAWSADSRTLYLSCSYLGPDTALKATFAVDAATGAALVDAEGRWKVVAPMTDVDARGAVIVGAGAALRPPVGTDTQGVRYAPLTLTNLALGTRAPLYAAVAETPLPDYAFTRTPALSGKDNRYVAFSSVNKGLWIFDRTTQQYRPLLERNVTRPRWAAEATSLYFLEARPAAPGGKPSFDLYAADFVPSTGQLGLPRPLLQGVDWFDIVPG
ncbi:MAG: hypothetical protein H7Z41_05105 [Cytophagales bacterium]|nr:hypothetical protein [Armatimonadota bacterium]